MLIGFKKRDRDETKFPVSLHYLGTWLTLKSFSVRVKLTFLLIFAFLNGIYYERTQKINSKTVTVAQCRVYGQTLIYDPQ